VREAGFPGCVQISVSDQNKALTQKSEQSHGHGLQFIVKLAKTLK
jgi:hypothetical protein